MGRIRKRTRMFNHQNGLCYLCSLKLESSEVGIIEHKIPRSRGGTDAVDNLGLAHYLCDYQKGNLTEQEYLSEDKGGARLTKEGRWFMSGKMLAHIGRIKITEAVNSERNSKGKLEVRDFNDTEISLIKLGVY